jgi:outer membrane lipoprotein-sorting protein
MMEIPDLFKNMMYAKFKWPRGLSLAILLATGATSVVFSSDAAGDGLSSSQILQKVLENYASLASYSDEGKVVVIMGGTTNSSDFTIRLARMNLYRIEWQQNSASSSTKNAGPQAVWSSGAGDHLEIGFGQQYQCSREIALAEASIYSDGAAVDIPRIFFNMQWEDQLADLVLGENQQTDEKVEGKDCYVFTGESQGRTKTLWIGKQDFLIHQVRIILSAEAIKAMSSKWTPSLMLDVHGFTSIEIHTNIVVNRKFCRSDFVPSFPSFPSVDSE